MVSEHIKDAIKNFKTKFEETIGSGRFNGTEYENGLAAKNSLIKSSQLINLIHEAIKKELIDEGIEANRIIPSIEHNSPELKIAGFLKMKNQDVCVKPLNIARQSRVIDWGPLQYDNVTDPLGHDYAENTIVVNVRSQMSSLSKNVDTLFERTFAEPLNLHLIYPKMVIGEVFLIPLNEYDTTAMKNNEVGYNEIQSDINNYLNFFSAINGRKDPNTDLHKYERCSLIIVDFNNDIPFIYSTTQQLKNAGIISEDSNFDYDLISIEGFVKDLIAEHKRRFNP